MVNRSGDTAEMVSLSEPGTTATQPGSIDPSALRRAMIFGQKSRPHLPGQSFHDAEDELRRLWARRGETVEWEWVRAAVRAGFEPESFTDDE
jgi:hypothetical protein